LYLATADQQNPQNPQSTPAALLMCKLLIIRFMTKTKYRIEALNGC